MLTDEFKREPRYIVIKIKDALAYLSACQLDRLQEIGETIAIGRSADEKPPFNAVVVEQDWPEFEPTWAAIEARMTGRAIEAEAAAQQGNAPAVEGLEVLHCINVSAKCDPAHPLWQQVGKVYQDEDDVVQFVRQSDAAAIIAKLEAQISATERLVVAGLRAEAERLTAELSDVSTAIGNDEYLDLPDGGSVSLAEQVSRMRSNMIRDRAELSAANERIAELEQDASFAAAMMETQP